MALIFSGIVWVQLTRRAHSVRIPQSVGQEAPHLTGIGDETGSSEREDEFHDISSFGNVDYSKRKGKVARRGVGAIFSSDKDWSAVKHEGSRRDWISPTMLLNVIGWSLFLVVYAFLVQEYGSNPYMQSYIHTKLGFGAYLLNDYTLLITATALGFLIFRMLFLNWHQAKTRRLNQE